jgi:hypothetical protein
MASVGVVTSLTNVSSAADFTAALLRPLPLREALGVGTALSLPGAVTALSHSDAVLCPRDSIAHVTGDGRLSP